VRGPTQPVIERRSESSGPSLPSKPTLGAARQPTLVAIATRRVPDADVRNREQRYTDRASTIETFGVEGLLAGFTLQYNPPQPTFR
jgi:hypothetical protein